MFDKLEKVLMPLADKIGRNAYLVAIRDGFLVASPLMIVSSFFLLFANFPIKGWTEFWAGILGENWTFFAEIPTQATTNLVAIFSVMGIGYSFAKEKNVHAIGGAASALVAFFILTPFSIAYTPKDMDVVYNVSGLPMKWIGSSGLFIGMIASFIAVLIFKFVYDKGWTIKLPPQVPPTVSQSFSSLIPSAFVIVIFLIIRILFAMTPFETAHNFIFTFLQTPLVSLGNTLGAMIIAYLFLHFFWFFGVNGSSVVGAVYNPVLSVLTLENRDAFTAHKELPNIINGSFQDLFATFGGAGSTLSLLIAMFFFCKSRRIKELGKLSIIPGIFGINEPIIFGLPVVLNPVILIPFVLVPTINIIITYFCMLWGIVPYCNGVSIPWTTPVIISGFLSTGWTGSVLQAFLLALGVVIYYPFIKSMDKQYLLEEQSGTDEEDDDDFSLDDLSFDDL